MARVLQVLSGLLSNKALIPRRPSNIFTRYMGMNVLKTLTK